MGVPVMRIEPRRQSDDCATWALATYTGVPYDKVWQTVQKVDRSKGKNGLHTRTIQRVGAALGKTLRLIRKPDIQDSYGMLEVENKKTGHIVVLRNGLIFDTDNTNWEVDAWLMHYGYVVTGLLTMEGV
jgi:hypothetical protein